MNMATASLIKKNVIPNLLLDSSSPPTMQSGIAGRPRPCVNGEAKHTLFQFQCQLREYQQQHTLPLFPKDLGRGSYFLVDLQFPLVQN